MPRVATGNPHGRPKGAEGGNKREARALLRDKFPDYHPLVQMAALANDEGAPQELRFAADKEVAAYLLPKLKAVEVTGPAGGAIVVQAVSAADDDL